jgi:NADH-quinone oxidoreductase E subunit
MSFHPAMDYGRGRFQSARALPEEGEPFVYTAEHRATLDGILTHYPPDRRKSAVIAALYLVQRQQGHVTRHAMRHVAEVIGCTAEEVEEVVSFYTMFYTRPVGRRVIQVCRTLSCALMGAERVTEALAETLNVRPGETDATGEFTLVEVECLGACDRAPVVGVDDHWHECQRPEDVRALIEGLRTKGEAALTGCHLRVAGDSE